MSPSLSRPARLVAALAASLALASPVVAAAPATASSEPAARRAVPYEIRPFVPDETTPPVLATHWERWQERGLTRYRTRVMRGCFCPQVPVRVTDVHGRRVVRVRDVGEGRRAHGYELDRLYRIMQQALRSGADVDVVWRGGVPRHIAIDPDPMIVDEESYYTVKVTRLGRR